MTTNPSRPLSVRSATALYVGALLGPSLLLLPGLAAAIAGPASILAWLGLLMVSALLARVFAVLGTRFRSAGGVAAYAAAGLGPRAGRLVGMAFLAGVVLGAPVVCLVGAGYLADLFGVGAKATVAIAAALLVVVVALTAAGTSVGARVQLILVSGLVVLVVAAVLGSAPSARLANWTPFAPHGLTSIGSAASVLMLSFVGWEAIAPLTVRLADVRRQLPRVMTAAFAITAVLYLGLAAATIAVLGSRAGGAVPLADLLRVAVGPIGGVVAAIAAIALTLAATNAYLTGAAALLTELQAARPHRAARPARTARYLQAAVAIVGLLLFGADLLGLVGTTQLVALPTAMFLLVYLGCTLSATRILTGTDRIVAGLAATSVGVVFAFSGGAALLAIGAVVLAATISLIRARRPPRRSARSSRSSGAASAQADQFHGVVDVDEAVRLGGLGRPPFDAAPLDLLGTSTAAADQVMVVRA